MAATAGSRDQLVIGNLYNLHHLNWQHIGNADERFLDALGDSVNLFASCYRTD